MNKLQMAEQFRKALQLFAASLDDEKAMEVASIYDPWAVGKAYSVGDFVTYGVNGVGDPQLYKVVQAHTSQADWTPDAVASLFVLGVGCAPIYPMTIHETPNRFGAENSANMVGLQMAQSAADFLTFLCALPIQFRILKALPDHK